MDERLYTKQVTKNQLREVRGRSRDLFKQGKIDFVRETKPESSTKSQTNEDAAIFYSKLIGKTEQKLKSVNEPRLKTFNCPICHVEVTDTIGHSRSISHLSALDRIESPVEPIKVSKENLGYKYLSKYGWTKTQRHGLGATGNEGRRMPIKVEKPVDKRGIGGKMRYENAQDKDKKTIRNKKDALRFEREEKKKIRAIREELR